MKPKPIVGQIIYSLNIGNAARHRAQELTPLIVRKVGRKYFSASSDDSPGFIREYYIDTWAEKTEFSCDSKIYSSPKEWDEERESDMLTRMIAERFDRWLGSGVPLNSLRKIAAILSEEKPADTTSPKSTAAR